MVFSKDSIMCFGFDEKQIEEIRSISSWDIVYATNDIRLMYGFPRIIVINMNQIDSVIKIWRLKRYIKTLSNQTVIFLSNYTLRNIHVNIETECICCNRYSDLLKAVKSIVDYRTGEKMAF